MDPLIKSQLLWPLTVFAHLTRILPLGRLRLRGPCGAQFEFTLAQSHRTCVVTKLVVRPPPAACTRKVEPKRLDPAIAIRPMSSLMPVPPGGTLKKIALQIAERGGSPSLN